MAVSDCGTDGLDHLSSLVLGASSVLFDAIEEIATFAQVHDDVDALDQAV